MIILKGSRSLKMSARIREDFVMVVYFEIEFKIRVGV